MLNKCDEFFETLNKAVDHETVAKALDFCGENNFSGVRELRFQNFYFADKPVKEIVELVKQGQLNDGEVAGVSQQLRSYIKDSKEEILKKKSDQFMQANALIMCYQAYNLLTIHGTLKEAGELIQNEDVFVDLKKKADNVCDQIEKFKTTNESAKGKKKIEKNSHIGLVL